MTGPRTSPLDQETLDELARFLDEEVPGVKAPDRCQYISWADGPASWVYRPALEDSADAEGVSADV